MGCHASRTLCKNADDTAAATGAATQLSTYAGAPLDAVVAYERAALRLSHDPSRLRRSAEVTTEIALVRNTASPTGGSGSATASQPPRSPLLGVCIDVQKALRRQHEQKQHHHHTDEGKEVVAVDTAYQDGVPVLLQELAWEWFSGAAGERQGRATNAGRPPVLSAEQMEAWKTRTAQLLHAYVSSRRYKKALQRARKAAATGARVRHPAVASAVGRDGEVRSGSEHGAPEPRVFRTLFKSYAELGRTLTRSRSAAAGSAANFKSAVTPSMWCAVLCWLVRALPEPLMPSLCSRRLEPFAGAPPSRSVAATAPTSATHATYTAVRRVVSESFISTNVVAYTTFCYVLDLVHAHRTELTGDEVEAVARAIVREPSLAQTTREVAHACDPEARMFWPPRTSVAASSLAASAAMARAKEARGDDRHSGNSMQDRSGSKRVAAAGGRETGTHSRLAAEKPAVCAAVEVVVKAPTPSTTPVAAGGGMRRPPTSSSSASDSEKDDSESERHPPAVATRAIPAAAQPTEDMHRASPVPHQGLSKTVAAAVAHPQPDRRERYMASSEAPFLKVTPSAGESSSSAASEHRRHVAQRSTKQPMSLSEDEDVQRPSVPASRRDLTAISMSRLNSALYPSALEDPAAVEAEAEDLRCALQRFSESSLSAAASIRNDDDGDGIHSRSPSGESGSPQSTSTDKVSASFEPVPPRPPRLSSPHHITPTSTSSQRDERHLLRKCGGAATPTPAVALLPPPLAQRSVPPLPATAFRAQAEQPLLTALMVAKQRFLAALKMTPGRETTAALSPPQTAQGVGRTAARDKDCSDSFADCRLEHVMACARQMGWSSPESLIKSLKAAQWHSHAKTPAITDPEAAALPSPHVPALKPDVLSSSSDRHALPRLPQPRAEAPHQARKGAAVSRATLAGGGVSARDGPVSQPHHTPHQRADACHASPSSRTVSANSAMRVEATRVLCSGGAAHVGLPSGSLLSPPATESSRMAGTGHAHLPAPLHGHDGLVSSGLTDPLAIPSMPTSATAGATAAQPLIELEQELTKLRHLVRTLESKQFAQAHQASTQASELQAQYAELRYQQLEQAKQLRLARGRLISVGSELEGLRDVKTHLQVQLTTSQHETARLRDALLVGETRARGVR